MKHPLLSLLLFIVSITTTHAQITLTKEDFPAPGDNWNLYYGVNLKLDTTRGPMQTWDFSHSVTVNDSSTDAYVAPGDLYDNQLMPDATVGINNPDDTASTFHKTDSTGYYYLGSTREGYPDSVFYSSPPFVIMPAPFTYGNTRHTANTKFISLPFFSIPDGKYLSSVSWSTQDFTADAYGNLTTPFYNNIPALRIKVVRTYADSAFKSNTYNGPRILTAHTENTKAVDYRFVKKGRPYLAMFLSIYKDSTDAGGVTFYSGGIPTTVSVAAPSPVFTKVYPNPATADVHFTINNAGAKWLTIYNLAGQCLLTENIAGADNIVLNSGALNSGIYFYRLTTANGIVLDKNRFVVENK